MPRQREKTLEFQLTVPGTSPAAQSFFTLLGRKLTPAARARLAGVSLVDAGLSPAVCAAIEPLAIRSMLDVAVAWPWQIDRMVAAGISRPRLAAAVLEAAEGRGAADPRLAAGRKIVVDVAERIVALAQGRPASGEPGRRAPKRSRARLSVGAPKVAQLRIALREVEPLIWRRVQVPLSLTLRQLHDVIQRAMGWTDHHLHQFDIGGTIFGMTEPEAEPMMSMEDDRVATLQQVAPAPGVAMIYDYDFGDGWSHDVVVEEVRPAGAAARRAICLDGARACPPEDCGGPHQYSEDLVRALAAKRPTREQRELLEWLPPGFDPEAFDLDAANRRLRSLKLGA